MKTIELTDARARKPEWSMAEPVNFTLEEGEHIAIVGRNGAGKSMFVDTRKAESGTEGAQGSQRFAISSPCPPAF